MKPCASNRKLIVWLTLNTLGPRQTQQLRAHLETCAGCRQYLAEISHVSESLAAAEYHSDIEASETFHRKVAGKLRSAKTGSLAEIVTAYFRGITLKWRLAAPAVAALVIGIIVATRPSVTPRATMASGADHDLEPTLANYQQAADQSLEKFDALLTRQSRQMSPPGPIYTVSTSAFGKESF